MQDRRTNPVFKALYKEAEWGGINKSLFVAALVFPMLLVVKQMYVVSVLVFVGIYGFGVWIKAQPDPRFLSLLFSPGHRNRFDPGKTTNVILVIHRDGWSDD